MTADDLTDTQDFQNFPFIIGWELTLACNLRCGHCASTAGKARADELSLQEAIQICDQFSDLFVQEVDFTGGEPLLCEYLPELLKYLQNLEISAKILSNGHALSRDRVHQLHDLGIEGIGISIDGLASEHDSLRGHPGLFEGIFSNIAHIQKLNIPLTIITSVTSQNIDSLPSLRDHLIGCGIKSWQLQPLFPLGRSKTNQFLQLSDKDYMQLGELISKWRGNDTQPAIEIMPADSYGYYTYRDQRNPTWQGCPAGLYSCGITSNGKIKGCLSMPDELIQGDLREQDLWEIWFNPESFPYTRQFCSDKLGNNCKDCDRASECRGGCSAMSYGCTGNFNDDPYCLYRLENTL